MDFSRNQKLETNKISNAVEDITQALHTEIIISRTHKAGEQSGSNVKAAI